MSDTTSKAVFLSYASQDAEAARRICEALCAAGVEVWFDQSELRGGDAWDQKIRRQIRDCALFIPVISAHTQSRREGYFRLEWKLADDRTHLMAKGTPFLVPVCVDDTKDWDALVPDSFMTVQWTRLPEGGTAAAFVARVAALLQGTDVPAAVVTSRRSASPQDRAQPRAPTARAPRAWLGWAVGVGALVAALVFAAIKMRNPPGPATSPQAATATSSSPAANDAAARRNADRKAIAVLPFENLSPEAENAFFADGVHQDVIFNLGKIRDLTVTSRASVMSYRDPVTRDLRKIAAELGVSTLLVGSVRRAGSQVRVTFEAIEAQTGTQLAVGQHDHALTEGFAVQTAIAQQIATALQANLTASERDLIARRATEDAEAYDLFLRARILEESMNFAVQRTDYERVLALYEAAVVRDPKFALAYVRLAAVHGRMYWFGDVDPSPERRARAVAAMETARGLAPNAPETRLGNGIIEYLCHNNWRKALAEFQAAEVSLPKDALLHESAAVAHRRLGEWHETKARCERAIQLNPRALNVGLTLIETLFMMRRYREALELGRRYAQSHPTDPLLRNFIVRCEYALGGPREPFLDHVRARAAANPTDVQAQYLVANAVNDRPSMARALADPNWTVFRFGGGIGNDPVDFRRAYFAFTQRDRAAAQRYAEAAIGFYRRSSWAPRQERFVELRIALCEALAGGGLAALARARAVIERERQHDVFNSDGMWTLLADFYETLGFRDQAMETLREAFRGLVTTSPREIRDDWQWAAAKEDPRFEEILRSAKPL